MGTNDLGPGKYQSSTAQLRNVYDGPPVTAGRGGASVGVQTQHGTVFDEKAFVARKTDNSLAVAATTKKIRGASQRFFIVAAFSALQAFALWNSNPPLAAGSAIEATAFLIVGIFAFRLNRLAFIGGMALYGLLTISLVPQFLDTWDPRFALAIFSRCVILYRLYLAHGLICDLETD